MSVPKSITKVSKDGAVTFKDNVNQVEYYIEELTRGALRDVGKFIAKLYRNEFYSKYNKQTGQVGKGIGYWARKREKDLQVGMAKKGKGFWGMILYNKDSQNFMKQIVMDNVGTIEDIEAQYLSALSQDSPSLAGLSEGDYQDEGN